MNDTLLVIPAIKKNAIIPDQLIKKLNGTTLIQRAINLSLELVTHENVLVITDSEEISLICERNHIPFFYEATLQLKADAILSDMKTILLPYTQKYQHLILYRANAPLVDSSIIKEAFSCYLKAPDKIFVSVKEDTKSVYTYKASELKPLDVSSLDAIYEEVKAFKILSTKNLSRSQKQLAPYLLPHEKSIEILSYQDWWVCEKVLKQKRIVFNVIGSIEVGMGHIYRALSLAHEITDHEVIFVCDAQYDIAVSKIAATDYHVISSENVIDTLIELKPDLVINDVLNTTTSLMEALKSNRIKVVNFEDLGEGSVLADLVFNELYDTPQREGNQYRWGYQYMALRDEFYEAKPHAYKKEIKAVLITFGGTDQNNLTLMALKSILPTCKRHNIEINIVCGAGYLYKEALESFIVASAYEKIETIYSVGVISKIMEKTPLAISSNGRTVYELADMNITSIIISHHERENTHRFASLEKGFLNLNVYDATSTPQRLRNTFDKIIDDNDYRKLLYLNIAQFSFRNNKHLIMRQIMELL